MIGYYSYADKEQFVEPGFFLWDKNGLWGVKISAVTNVVAQIFSKKLCSIIIKMGPVISVIRLLCWRICFNKMQFFVFRTFRHIYWENMS